MAVSFQKYSYKPQTITATQITADNRAEIASLLGGTVVDGVIEFERYGEINTAADGAYLSTDPVDGYRVIDGTVFANMLTEALVGPSLVGATGRLANPAALAAGLTTDITVPLRREMPSTDYTPMASVVGGVGAALTGARVVGIVAWAKGSVTVRVQNTGLSAISSGGFVVAVAAIA